MSDRCKHCNRPLSDNKDMRHGYETCSRCAPGHVPEGSRYRENPWWSPPAMQYVARFTGNPPTGDAYYDDSEYGHQCPEDPHEPCWICGGRPVCPGCPECVEKNPVDHMPFLEWGTKTKGYGLLDHVEGYQGPPGTDFAKNPRPTVALGWFVDSKGRIYTAGETDQSRKRGFGKFGRTVRGKPVTFIGDWHWAALRPRGWEKRRKKDDRRMQEGPWSPEFQAAVDRAAVESSWREGKGEHTRMARPSSRYRGRHEYFSNPEPRHDVLCECGWGRLAMPEDEIPDHCPVCGTPIGGPRGGGHSDDYWHGVQIEQEDWDDPSWGAAYGDDWSRNPKYFTRGRGAVARPFSKGTLKRTMETDPMHESRMKGMLAFYGKKLFGLELTSRQIESMLGKGRKELGNRTATAKYSVKKGVIRVGRREIPVGPIRKGQKVKLADVKARVDAVFYSQSRRMGTLEGVSISEDTIPAPAKRAKKAPKRKLPKKAKKKAKKRKRTVANPKKKRSRPVPPKSQRCVEKKKNGSQCKGRRLPGQKVCVCHSSKSSMIGRKRA